MLEVVYARTSVVDTVNFIALPALSLSSTLNQYGLEGADAGFEGLPASPPLGLVALLGVADLSLNAQ